jgi:hypothetical protein
VLLQRTQNQQVKKKSEPIRVDLKTTNINKLSALCDRSGVSISGSINAAVQLGLKNTKAIIQDAKDAKQNIMSSVKSEAVND